MILPYLFTSYQLTFKMHKTKYSFFYGSCFNVVYTVFMTIYYIMLCIYIHIDENFYILFYLLFFRFPSAKVVVNFACMHYVCKTNNQPVSLWVLFPDWIFWKFMVHVQDKIQEIKKDRKIQRYDWSITMIRFFLFDSIGRVVVIDWWLILKR